MTPASARHNNKLLLPSDVPGTIATRVRLDGRWRSTRRSGDPNGDMAPAPAPAVDELPPPHDDTGEAPLYAIDLGGSWHLFQMALVKDLDDDSEKLCRPRVEFTADVEHFATTMRLAIEALGASAPADLTVVAMAIRSEGDWYSPELSGNGRDSFLPANCDYNQLCFDLLEIKARTS